MFSRHSGRGHENYSWSTTPNSGADSALISPRQLPSILQETAKSPVDPLHSRVHVDFPDPAAADYTHMVHAHRKGDRSSAGMFLLPYVS